MAALTSPTAPTAAPHAPILIEGDQGFRPANGVVGGRGTASDPYVIEGWEINASAAHGVDIRNTTAYVVLRNVTIAGGAPFYDGVRLTNVVHARLEGLNLTDNEVGAHLRQVRDSAVRSSNVTGGYDGIIVEGSTNITLEGIGARSIQARGLFAWTSSVLTVRSWNVSAGNVGMFLEEVDSTTVAASTVIGGISGIEFYQATWSTVEGNRVTDAEAGVFAFAAQQVTIQDNEIFRNGGSDLQIFRASGIFARLSSGMSIIGNNLSENLRGIVLDESSGMILYGNEFRSNGLQASDTSAGANRWDNGYPTGGNYWSNSTAWDECRGLYQDDCTAGDGLGDMPYSPGSGIVDHFPLVPVSPPNVPPIAAFSYVPLNPMFGNGIDFDASASVDPDGWPLRFNWTFGDGTSWEDTRPTATHMYAGAGPYHVVLTVIDVRKASASTAADVRVPQLPIPSFTFTPARPVVGETITFDASASYDPDGTIVRYRWDFGDSSYGTGVVSLHSYEYVGSYVVSLTAEDDTGLTSWGLQQTVYVYRAPPPPVELTTYSHPSGFRLPIPANWTRQEDQVIEGEMVELVLIGPTQGSIQTNILVDTGSDPAVRETSAYLLDVADATVRAAQSQTPDTIEVSEGPTVRTIGGHAAVTFKLQYGTTSLYQKIAIIVSEAHQRYWILVLTTDAFSYPVMDDAFERMLAGFEIVESPFGALGFPVAVLVAGLVAAASIGMFVLLRARSRKAGRLSPPEATAAPSGAFAAPSLPRATDNICPVCGARSERGAGFCGRCGTPLPPRP